MTQPRAALEWEIYANATFAGLAVLIPIPLVDWIFEEVFRRRMPAAITSYRNQAITPPVIKELNKQDGITGQGCLRSCGTILLLLTYGLLKRISRKIFYFLTIKEATDKVNFYWHQAFLIDHMLTVGHLANEETARTARQAMDEVLRETTTSPMLQLAQQVTAGTRHILKTLRRVRRGREDEVVEQKRSQMIQQWAKFDDYLAALAVLYDQTYKKIKLGRDTKREKTDSGQQKSESP